MSPPPRALDWNTPQGWHRWRQWWAKGAWPRLLAYVNHHPAPPLTQPWVEPADVGRTGLTLLAKPRQYAPLAEVWAKHPEAQAFWMEACAQHYGPTHALARIVQWQSLPLLQVALRHASRGLHQNGFSHEPQATPAQQSRLVPGALTDALARGWGEGVVALVTQGAQCNWPWVMVAATRSQSALVAQLLAAGDDPNACTPDGQTALGKMAREVKHLLFARAHHGSPQLSQAEINARLCTAQLLIQAGGDMHRPDGKTARAATPQQLWNQHVSPGSGDALVAYAQALRLADTVQAVADTSRASARQRL